MEGVPGLAVLRPGRLGVHEGDLTRPDHAHAPRHLLHVLGVPDALDLSFEPGPLGHELADARLEPVYLGPLSQEVPHRAGGGDGQHQNYRREHDRAGGDPTPRSGLGPGAQRENLR